MSKDSQNLIFMPNTTIEINGKTYNSINEVPQEFRDLIRDENQDGMPDKFEHFLKDLPKNAQNTKTAISIQKTFAKNVSWPQKPNPDHSVPQSPSNSVTRPSSSNQELLIRLAILALGIALGAFLLGKK